MFSATLVRGGQALAANADKTLPTRLRVLAWGDNPNARGKPVRVGEKLRAALAAPTYPFRKIPLDFEHNTLEGTPAYAESREPRPVAGFAFVEVVPGEGVFLNVDGWTPEGEANAANYCDLSAAAITDADGEVVMIPSAALCRCGAVEGMDFAQVALNAELVPDGLTGQTQTEESMNWKEMICKALGIDPASADEDVAKAFAAALSKKAELDTEALNAALKPVQDSVVSLSARFEQELEKRDKTALLERAAREGKVVALSAEAVGKLSVADLTAHVDGLKATVPLSAKTPADLPPGKAGEVSAERRAIALNCGLDPEKVFQKG